MRPATLILVAAITACGSGSSNPTGPDVPSGTSAPVLAAHLTDLSRVRHIVPTGSVSGDEIKGHAFVQTDGAGPVPVYAPVDMVLNEATWVGMSDDFGFQFDINQRFRLRLGHITDPRADIAALVPRDDPSSIFSSVGPLSIAAGELIGYTTGTVQTNGFDFGLYDLSTEVNTPNAQRYRQAFDWEKLNSVCGFSYFSADIRGAYYGLFGSIGGQLVPGAPCRTISDVVGEGGLAGEWFLADGTPNATYPSRFAVGSDLGGTSVRVAGIAGSLDAFGAPDPQSVRDEACYADSGRWVFLRLSSPTVLDALAGEGDCPAEFPGGGRVYGR